MSYISAIVPSKHDNIVRVWERDSSGDRITLEYEAPYFFYIDDEDGEFTTIYDTKVTKIDCGTNRKLFYKKRNEYQDKGITVWESDIGAELRVLSSEYYDKPAPKLNVTFLDIENNYSLEQGYSGPKNPYAEINAISLFHEHTNTMISLSVPPDDGIPWTNELLEQACNDILPLPIEYKTIFIVCRTEKELLEAFLNEIKDSDLLVGWNSMQFDHPFIGKRIEIALGEHRLRDLSFPNAEFPYFSDEETDFSKLIRKKNPLAEAQTYIKLNTSGRMLADYMILFKKYEPTERASYKLSSISDEVLVDEHGNPTLPKLEYSGALHDLYVKDFAFFVRYNIRDSEILHGFEMKLGYVELANEMYHMSCGLFQHVGGTLKLAELAITNHCHHVIKRVVNNTPRDVENRKIEGALVLLPQIGLHEMLGSIDVTSLYPNSIISINASIEQIRGQFIEEASAWIGIISDSDEEFTLVMEKTGEEIIATGVEWKEFLIQQKWVISGFGTVFDQSSGRGIVPIVLADWFIRRKDYQKKKKAADRKLEELVKKYKHE